MNLALFDFDGTISFKDSFIEFLKFTHKDVFYLKFMKLLPFLIAYKIKIIPNYQAKEIVLTDFYKDYDYLKFLELGKIFSIEILPNILRKKAIEKLSWYQEQGDKIVIVTASLKEYLQIWCEQNNFDLIASELDVQNGFITGKLKGANCYGEEKIKQIKEKYNLKEFNKIYAYGDTKGDLPMLNLADEKFYKPFK